MQLFVLFCTSATQTRIQVSYAPLGCTHPIANPELQFLKPHGWSRTYCQAATGSSQLLPVLPQLLGPLTKQCSKQSAPCISICYFEIGLVYPPNLDNRTLRWFTQGRTETRQNKPNSCCIVAHIFLSQLFFLRHIGVVTFDLPQVMHFNTGQN